MLGNDLWKSLAVEQVCARARGEVGSDSGQGKTVSNQAEVVN